MLANNGFQTLEAETVESVLSDLARIHFDLAVIDIFMPGMGGIEGIAKIKEIWTDIKIIAISVGVGEMDKNMALKAAALQGADRALAKPFTDEDMMAVVNELLGLEEVAAG